MNIKKPKEIIKELPISQTLNKFIDKSRKDIKNILDKKDNRLLIITGPCSIDNYNAAIDYAIKLKNLSDKVNKKIVIVMRTYFEKPRSILGWKGLIYDPDLNETYDMNKGIIQARKLLLEINQIGLPTATEFLNPIVQLYINDLISYASIGARTSESQTHREFASSLDMPVGIKNNTQGDIQTAINAILATRSKQSYLGIDENFNPKILNTKGNTYSHIILRGGRNKPNYDNNSINNTITLLKKSNLPNQIIVDCSHANSNKNYKNQELVFNNVLNQRISRNKSILGLMLESYIESGNQKISEKKYGISITDECINFETTKELILNAYNRL